ncbi:MAG: serine hydroxymethyltransferase [Hyphomicrobiaceae bacterium]|nr:serine hydroxymethyltransferase [Hyphomicrobiaceae bacterium]MCC0024483.1 serine hydroxymethyltransferase [Hyphomicrobiaceae bacterium]
MNGDAGREVLFEFRAIGNQWRVTALDPKTGIEVVIVAPRNASREDIKKIAAAKLQRALANRR